MAEQMMGPGTMEEEPMPMDRETESEDGEEQASIFISKQALGGKTYKEGDTITLTVSDVDPETGDVQADLTSGGETEESPGYAKDFDNAMPEQGETEV